MSWLFLTSGLFLGWSLGANDAANLFGTAVATRMLKFRTAALVGGVFVVIGAWAGAHGTSKTLGRLGAIDAPAGAFVVALAAAAAVVLLLTRSGLPVSITQAIVGAILGWNLFNGKATDLRTLTQLLSSWLLSPVLAGLIAAGLFVVSRRVLQRRRVHLLEVDAWTRTALLVAGAFGAFSLGLNDIANVMGVFVRVSPFPAETAIGPFRFTSVELLFLLGGIAIAVGIATYSGRVMVRLGSGLTSLSPLAGLIVVLAAALVLFLFGSPALQRLLRAAGLPGWPLVPVSATQAVVGAIVGISLVRKSGIRLKPLGQIAIGWVAAPAAALLFALVGLFVVQNVFELPVSAMPRPAAGASAVAGSAS
ncbi:MAG TPA: inorganic phosphate transporter [Thermoanaerobaculia bacterium]|nr:inorganic phosphate transporter [Thermoanaerobaculia bacterium]HQN06152.1 inorganic phosphate transporter [Thermoanaerobaculia bacterium]HQP85940.1 inorganic phosphate transporter [Thermoanaerobaculia bacterium]